MSGSFGLRQLAGGKVLGARVGTVQGHGLALTYTEWRGSGNVPALLLLHGIAGSSADWGPVVESLLGSAPASFSRVIALDARGHGASDWSPGAEYSGDSHFADVACAVDGLALPEFVLAGYSMGGGVAMMVAAALPHRCRGLVVIDSYPDPEMSRGSLAIARSLARWWEDGRPASGPPTGPWGGALFDPALARSFAVDLAAGQARRLDLWPFWTSLQCRTLLIRGERSPVVPAAAAGRMLAAQRLARMAEVPGAAHALLLGFAPTVAREIQSFVEGAP